MKTAIITGANRGIGIYILREFAFNGWNVISLSRSLQPEVKSEYDELASKYSISITHYAIDLSSEEEIKEFTKYVHKNKIVIDALVNNAGIGTGGTMMMTTTEQIKKVFQVNYYAPFLLTQYASKNMMRNKVQGCIVNVGSVAALEAIDGFTAYGSSKAALLQSTKIWAKEMAGFKIRVNAVAPGAVNTEMANQMDEKTRELLINKSAMTRMGEPEEIANLVYFLATDKSSYINGQVIRIDGCM